MVEQFDQRFIVIADRWDYPGGQPRSLEDLKERYYGVARKLLVRFGGGGVTAFMGGRVGGRCSGSM